MKISVVIVTCNRNSMLKKCLDSVLIDQTRLPDEVVVVNAGQEDVFAVTNTYEHIQVEIRVVKTDNISLTINRNVGIRTSSHELIAFTDDDCVVNPDWIKIYCREFEKEQKIGSMGGRIFDINSCWFAHNIDEMSMTLSDYIDIKRSPFCYYFRTANICYRKEVLGEINLFDEDFKESSSDDLIVGLKILLSGYKNKYCSENSVKHYGRGDSLSMIKKLFMYGRNIYIALQRFRGTQMADLYRINKSVLYLLCSSLTGSIKDAFRLRNTRNILHTFFFSSSLKLFINAGIIYGRLTKNENKQ